jgi:alpha-L-fucosidase
MRRRNFLLGGLAAGSAFLPLSSPTLVAAASPPSVPAPADEFDHYTQDYAHFCAMPESKRVFYALHNGKIVSERLHDQPWDLKSWPRPPDLPVPGGSHDGVPMESPIPNLAGEGPYQPTWESLLQYDCPEWYRDAKFGIWNHWTPQCVPEDGDWYAHYMYLQGSKQYDFHLAHYGPPSRFGYKDLCAQWTLLNWQPAELMDLYVRAGARFFVAAANHHDGFDTWNSQHHPWNAVNVGPHRDVIGTWAAEARRRQLPFGVTVHQAFNWNFFQDAHGADPTGPLAGIPYDGHLTLADGRGQWWEGLDPQRLYGPKHPPDALPHVSYVKDFYDRTRDLVDQHNPDLLYFDTTVFPLGWGGMNMGAYYYNRSLSLNGGKMGGVINVKRVPAKLAKSVVADYERGRADSILPYPWQSETCIGDWHYLRALFDAPGEYGGYMPPREIVHWLVDTVSKNGTFLLNIPGKPDGTLDSKERLILDRLGEWFRINAEAIYSTRPWSVFGEGPHLTAATVNGNLTAPFGAHDIRYTRNKANTVVYAIALGWPEEALLLRALGTAASPPPGKVARVELLGSPVTLRWQQTAEGLSIEPPRNKPDSDYAVVFKVSLA